MFEQELKDFLLSKGVSDVGFSYIDNSDTGELKYAVSIVVRLSDAIINEIGDEPTPTYFNHYRSVNAFIDRMLLETGLFLQSKGYNYITVAASQSMPGTPFNGRYSHKEAAHKAGLGGIGKNSLFIHKSYGTRVRLGTIFTDCPLEGDGEFTENLCTNCDRCVNACPSGAILGKPYENGVKREEIFAAEACSQYMKKQFQHIGRGAVCGICMKVCPYNKK
ncbi:MAG: epoxyqueuosine reductase [Clostridia bacterium]|nr:epoxyqueuosine reductase [Clostridia bacterium]